VKALKLQYNEKLRRYYARVQIGTVRKRFWFGRGKKKAGKELKALEQRIAAGEESFVQEETTARANADGVKDMLLKELAVRYLDWVQDQRTPGTYATSRHYVTAFCTHMGACMVASLSALNLMEFYSWAKRYHGSSDNAGNEYLRHVKTMLRWAEEYDVCHNPIRKFPVINYQPPPTKRVKEEDLRKLLAVCPPDFKDMILFGLLTGLRPQEIRLLRTDQILQDEDGRAYIRIEKHKTARSSRRHEPRTVPLSEAARQIVMQQIAAHPFAEHVFLNQTGTPYEARVLRQRLMRWCRKAHIAPITPYAWRHTFASMESEAGVNQISLAGLMGHTTVRTTARYVTNSADFHKSAVDGLALRIEALLSGNPERTKTGQKVATKVATNSETQNSAANDVGVSAVSYAS
jgi:integrase